MKWIIIAVLAVAGAAWGQTTKPAITPATQPVSLVNENSRLRANNAKLQRIILEMEDEIARRTDAYSELRSLYDAMLARFPTTRKSDDTTAEISKAILNNRLVIGMTLEQVNRSLGREGELTSEMQGGMQYYGWRVGNGAEYSATFEDGKLVAYSKYP